MFLLINLEPPRWFLIHVHSCNVRPHGFWKVKNSEIVLTLVFPNTWVVAIKCREMHLGHKILQTPIFSLSSSVSLRHSMWWSTSTPLACTPLSKLSSLLESHFLSTVTRCWARQSVLTMSHLIYGELCNCIPSSFHLLGENLLIEQHLFQQLGRQIHLSFHALLMIFHYRDLSKQEIQTFQHTIPMCIIHPSTLLHLSEKDLGLRRRLRGRRDDYSGRKGTATRFDVTSRGPRSVTQTDGLP